MTREPECCITPENPLALPNFYCICDRLESAYQRGRQERLGDIDKQIIKAFSNEAELEAAVQRVRDLHQPYPEEPHCQGCEGGPWPCDTIRALDGEQA